MSRQLYGYVEAQLDGNEPRHIRKATHRAANLLAQLPGKKTINGRLIGGIDADNIWEYMDKPCIIKDFGEKQSPNDSENGVVRLFGVRAITIDGWDEPSSLFGVYELDPDTRLIISGCSSPRIDTTPTPMRKISDL